MKKIYLSALFVCAGFFSVHAQSSEGGIPLSNQVLQIRDQQIAIKSYPTPDFTAILAKEIQDEKNGVAKPYMVSTPVAADISLEKSGNWSYLDDGRKVWRLAVSVPESQALGFLYDQYNLPKGVRLYLTNKTGKQILGAYTAQNNNQYNNFVSEPIQGDVVYLEMNIDAGVDISSIQFHINKVSAYYRGVDELLRFANAGATPARPTDASSSCHKNVFCPIPNVPQEQYEKEMNATVKITIQGAEGGGYCSGTLINNTGNSAAGSCTPLMLTASHCDPSNSRTNADFSQWQFKFNYYYEDCNGTELHSPSPTLNGASFKSRSNLPSFPPTSSEDKTLHLVGDFLLLQLSTPLDASLNTYLAGWNRNIDIANDINEDYYTFFIGFHHPKGDPKKKSWGANIAANGSFNQSQVNATHWEINFTSGGTEPGSSGSGLFDVDGLLIGDLSGGQNLGGVCGPEFGLNALYSKISYGWENEFDQTTFPQYAGAQSRLKDWLDPTNTGATKLPPTKSDCSDFYFVGVESLQAELAQSINLYPNPSNTGIIRAQFNLTKNLPVSVSVYNALGKLVKQFDSINAMNGSFSFDCSELSGGIYLMNFSSDNVTVGKKFIIAK